MLKKNLKRKKRKREDARPRALGGTLVIFCFYGILFLSSAAGAVEEAKKASGPAAGQDAAISAAPGHLSSRQANTAEIGHFPDPFVPFVSEETIKAESEAGKAKLTGLRQFEPGQLTLVAILFSGAKAVAVLQDPVGKGYTVRKGTKIGKAGEVKEIVLNKVIIRQRYYTMAGEQRFKNMEMVLHKKGEK